MHVFQAGYWNLTVVSVLEPSQWKSIFTIFFSSSLPHPALHHPSLHLLSFNPQPSVEFRSRRHHCVIYPQPVTHTQIHQQTHNLKKLQTNNHIILRLKHRLAKLNRRTTIYYAYKQKDTLTCTLIKMCYLIFCFAYFILSWEICPYHKI